LSTLKSDSTRSIILINNIETVILIMYINIFNIFTTLYDQYYGQYISLQFQVYFCTICDMDPNKVRLMLEKKIQITVNILCQSININNTRSVLSVFVNIDNIIDRVILSDI